MDHLSIEQFYQMNSSTGSEICVFPQLCYTIRSPLAAALSAGNNFDLEIDILGKHFYSYGDNIIVEESHFDTRWAYNYKSLYEVLLTESFRHLIFLIYWNKLGGIVLTKC